MATKTTTKFEALYDQADRAGKAAAEACTPTPMIVGSPSTPFGTDVDPTKKTYYVPQGVCGFAWVNLPGTTGFAKWLKASGYARTAHTGGVNVWVRGYGQSMELKAAYAAAFAEVLSEAGIAKVYPVSRMD